MVSALRKLQVAERLHKTSPVVLCAVCWDREQRKGRSAACLGWCEVGWVGSMERGPRRLLGGGEKLRDKWELAWQTSQEAGSVRDPGAFAELLLLSPVWVKYGLGSLAGRGGEGQG